LLHVLIPSVIYALLHALKHPLIRSVRSAWPRSPLRVAALSRYLLAVLYVYTCMCIYVRVHGYLLITHLSHPSFHPPPTPLTRLLLRAAHTSLLIYYPYLSAHIIWLIHKPHNQVCTAF
jgi:hypothetical protein